MNAVITVTVTPGSPRSAPHTLRSVVFHVDVTVTAALPMASIETWLSKVKPSVPELGAKALVLALVGRSPGGV